MNSTCYRHLTQMCVIVYWWVPSAKRLMLMSCLVDMHHKRENDNGGWALVGPHQANR